MRLIIREHPPLQPAKHKQYDTPNKNPRSGLKFTIAILSLTVIWLVCGENRSTNFLIYSWLLMTLAMAWIFFNRRDETLSAKNVVVLLYAASFSIAPVWLADLVGYHHIHYFGSEQEVESLLESSALITLVSLLCMMGGYLIVSSSTEQNTTPFDVSPKWTSYAISCAVLMTMVGLPSYLGLVMQSGGFSSLLGYSGGRADMFQGIYGAWFWGIHFLFSAYGLITVVCMKRHPWFCLLLAFALGMAFAPFQGRDIVIAPIFCWLLFYCGIHKPLPWRIVLGGAFLIIILSALLGAFRKGSERNDVEAFIDMFSKRASLHLTKVVSDNIEQLDSVMTAVRYLDLGNKTIGPMALLSWAEPLDRAFFGDSIPSILSGVFIDRLIMPEHKGWNTAASPSLPGELFLSLGWPGVMLGMMAYGAVFGYFMSWHDRRGTNPILYAAYPFVVFVFAKMIVDGSTHLFRALIVLIPVYAFSKFMPDIRPLSHTRDSNEKKPLFSAGAQPFHGSRQ